MKYFSSSKHKEEEVLKEPPIIIGLSKQERFAILGIVALNLPYDDLSYPRGSWNRRCLERICETLGLETSTVEALLPLIRKTSNWSMPPTALQSIASKESEDKASCEAAKGGTENKEAEVMEEVNPSWESPLEAAEREERMAVFMSMMPQSKEQLHNIVRLLLIVLVICVGYDGRARRLLQMVGGSMEQQWHPALGRGVRRDEEEMARLLLATAQAMEISKRRSSQWRAAKIAGATVGGGALLFVTGGLAAPALAAALTTAGVTGVAVTTLASSSTAVATLFGIGGATRCGLAMKRRTAGITEFEIMKQDHPALRPWSEETEETEVSTSVSDANTESVSTESLEKDPAPALKEKQDSDKEAEDDSVAKLKKIEQKEHESMSLVLCISGWINDQGDFERPWGAEPKEMELKERVYRFYKVHNPSQLHRVGEIVKDYRHHQELLLSRLKDKYKEDPMKPLVPRMPCRPLPDELSGQAELKDLMNWLDAKLKADAEAAKHNKSKNAAEIEEQDIPSFTTKPPAGSLIARLEAWEKRRDMLDTEEEDDKVMTILSKDKPEEAHESVTSSETITSPLVKEEPEEEEEDGHLEQKITVTDTDVSQVKERAAKLGISATSSETVSTEDKVDVKAQQAEKSQLKMVEGMWFWKQRFGSSEQLVLKWESEMLMKLGHCVSELVANASMSAAKEVAQYTVFAALVAAVAMPYFLIQLFDQIDKTWTIACERADAAGVLLAQTLLEKKHGSRPVTLIGFSMGARLIYSCLLELERVHTAFLKEQAEKENTQAEENDEICDSPVAGLIGDVVLMGIPMPVGRKSWGQARAVVAGRIMNCYSESDWTLGILYRSQRWSTTVAGIRPVKTRGVEDVNISHIVEGHADYPHKVKDILDVLKLDDDASMSF